jgi:hypothetical protein
MSDVKVFAAIGTDGTRPVVWGIGANAEEAIADGEEQLGDVGAAGSCDLRSVEISVARFSRIASGDVDASDL